VQNRVHPKSSIMEGYTTEEVVECCAITPAFYKNTSFANIEVHIGCISMYPAYKNPSKNNHA
jgi:hypothetical protein